MLHSLKLLLLAAITLLLLLFCVVNRHDMNINLFPLPYDISLPTYLFTLLMLLIGYSLASVIGSIKHLKQSYRLKKQSKRAHALENEIKGLKQDQLPQK